MKKVLGIFGNVALYGQERANIQVFEVLKKAGYDVLLAVNDRGFHWHIQPEIEKRNIAYKKIRFTWNLRKTLNVKLLSFYVRDVYKSNKQLYSLISTFNPDVIHVCNDTQVLTLLPTLLRISVPIVYRLGDKPPVQYKLYNFIWRYIITKRIDKFVCISEFIKLELLKVNPYINSIDIIYNFPTNRILSTSDFRNLPQRIPDVLTFVYIGQINEIKGVKMLVQAFERLSEKYKNIRLLLAGDIEHSGLAKELISKVSNSALKEKIQFLGKVEDIDNLLQIGDIGIFPSVYEEPLSNVIGEAKKNRKASIIFNSGGMPELIKHKKNGYIAKYKTIESLSEAMEYYLKFPDEITIHGEEAYQSMSELGLDYTTFRVKWLQIYE